jgi:hypothetical protein
VTDGSRSYGDSAIDPAGRHYRAGALPDFSAGVEIGLGDELLAAGEAKKLHLQTGRKVMIRGANGQARWHELWTGLPYIYGPNDTGECDSIINGPNARPYIEAKSETQWTWREYRPPPSEVCLSDENKTFGRLHAGRIVVDPHIKSRASPNKAWGWVNWNKLAWFIQGSGRRVTQIGPAGTQFLDGYMEFIETKDFRSAVAVLSKARVVICHEGALHHAAASLGVPTIVIRGGYISPEVTGYKGQIDFFIGDGLGCGMRVPCDHCVKCMRKIKPETVAKEALKFL